MKRLLSFLRVRRLKASIESACAYRKSIRLNGGTLVNSYVRRGR